MSIDRQALIAEIQRRQLLAEIERRKKEEQLKASLPHGGGPLSPLKKAASSILKPVAKAGGTALSGLDDFTKAVENEPVGNVLALPAFKKIASGDIKGALFFDPNKPENVVAPDLKLGTPKQLATHQIRTITDEAAAAANRTPLIGGVAGTGTRLTGRGLEGAAGLLLDPTNLLAIGIANKAKIAGEAGVAGVENAGRARKLLEVAAELAGRGSQSKKAYLATQAAAGFGSGVGGEVAGTPGALLGGFAGGWAGASSLDKARRLNETAKIEAQRISESARNLKGMNEGAVEGITASYDRYPHYNVAGLGDVPVLDEANLLKHIGDRDAATRSPGWQAMDQSTKDAYNETTDALRSVQQFMHENSQARLPIADPIDFGRTFRGAQEGDATAMRRFAEMSQAAQRNADLQAAAQRFPDFRYVEDQRGKISDIVPPPTPEIQAGIAQARDLQAQTKLNVEGLKPAQQAVNDAKAARKAWQEEVLAQMPSNTKSATKRYFNALVNNNGVEDAFKNLQSKARGADISGINEAAAKFVDLHHAVGEAETGLKNLTAAGGELSAQAKAAKAQADEAVKSHFGKSISQLQDRLIQIPGQGGRYRVKGTAIQDGKLGLDAEYIPPSKSIEESIGEGLDAKNEQAEALRNARSRVKELKANQARVRREGGDATGLSDEIRAAEADAKGLELARPRIGITPAGRQFIPLDDAREFVVYKPGKTGTPAALAATGIKDARTIQLLNDESRFRVRSQTAQRGLDQLDIERQSLEQKLLDPNADPALAERLAAVKENISGLQSEKAVADGELDRINGSILNSQQALEATLASAADEAATAQRLYEESLVQREANWAKLREQLQLSPEAAHARFMEKSREINDVMMNQLKKDVSGKRLTQGAYDELIAQYDESAVRSRNALNKAAQEAYGQLDNGVEREVFDGSKRAVISRLIASKLAVERFVDPDAWRNGLGGWFRRGVFGTGMRNAETEGTLAAFHNGESAAGQIADISYGALERSAATVNDRWLNKVASGVTSKEVPPAPGTTRYYHGTGSLDDITEARPEMFLTPNKGDAEVFAKTDAKLTGGKPRIYSFDAEPGALGTPLDASGTAVSRGAMRVLNPAGVKLSDAAATEAAWARSVQALKDPLERNEAILRNAAKPITDHAWKSKFDAAGIPEADRQQIYDALSGNFLTGAMNPNLFEYSKLDPTFHNTMKQFGDNIRGIEELAKSKGLMRNLLKEDYRDYMPTGRIQMPDGSIKTLKPAERSEITDLYEIMQAARMDPKRAALAEMVGGQPIPELSDMLIPGREWGTTQAANLLNKINKDAVWDKVSTWLKDPKAVEILKRGQDLQPNEWKNPAYMEDWPKLRDSLMPSKPTGFYAYMDNAARMMNKVAATVITGDASFGTVQGLIGAAMSPATTARMLMNYGQHAFTDEGWMTLMHDPVFRNKLIDRANRGMAVGRSSVTGVESAGNLLQEIPGLRKIGNGMAALDKIAFDRMQTLNKMNLIDTMEADVQMIRAFGRTTSDQFIDGIPTLERLHKEVNLYQSTPEEISNAIIRLANNSLGGLSKSQSLLGRNRQTLESTLLFVPGFFRARGGLINSVSKMLRNPNSPEGYLAASLLAREALFRMSFAAGLAAVTGTSDKFREESDSWAALDPRRPGGMLSGPLGAHGGYLGLSWGNSAPKLYAQMLAGNRAGEFNLNPKDRLAAVTDFFEGRTNPVIAAAINDPLIGRGHDFMGRPVQTPRDRVVNALQAVTPMFLANTLQTANEQDQTSGINPASLLAQTGADFAGVNMREQNATEKLNQQFQSWQQQKFPGEPTVDWRNAPSALKQMARDENKNVASSEQDYISGLARRVSESASQRDIIYNTWDERNGAFDNEIAKASADLSAGKISPADFKETYSSLQEDRADLAADMQAVLAKAGLKPKDEIGNLGAGGPQLAHLMAEYNAVKPQSISKRQVTEGGIIPDNDIDWTRYKQEQQAVLSKYSPDVVAQFKDLQKPDDPNVQRLQNARTVLDTYFDQLPKYRGLSNVEGKTLDAYKSVLNATASQFSDAGLKVDRQTVYLQALRQLEANGQITTPKQAQIAALAMRAALDPTFAASIRNLGAVQFLLENQDAFQWYPWLESEIPSQFRRLVPQQPADTSGIIQRELRGADLSTVR